MNETRNWGGGITISGAPVGGGHGRVSSQVDRRGESAREERERKNERSHDDCVKYALKRVRLRNAKRGKSLVPSTSRFLRSIFIPHPPYLPYGVPRGRITWQVRSRCIESPTGEVTATRID